MSQKYRRWLIFGSIGVLNTIVDVGLYLALRRSGLFILGANIVSTSVALAVSFSLNRRFTFQTRETSKKTIARFLIVTLLGLWVLQPILIHGVLIVLQTSTLDTALSQLYAPARTYYDLAAKLAATPATLVWNFVLYGRFVFKSNRTEA